MVNKKFWVVLIIFTIVISIAVIVKSLNSNEIAGVTVGNIGSDIAGAIVTEKTNLFSGDCINVTYNQGIASSCND